MSVPSETRPDSALPPAGTEQIKPALRQALLAARRAIPASRKKQWDKTISRHLLAYLKKHRLASVGVYMPIRGEPNLMPLYETLNRQGTALSLPVVLDKAAPLQFAAWQPGENMTKDKADIAVPETLRLAPRPQALLIPCLGFTSEKFRLGYGGGYFDRTLTEPPRPHAVGIAYACLQTRFPVEPHDIPLNCIITETGII
ncbi:MAG: 5-formyltetrahydrofolate cyclo-ligase [Oxalobacter formigenes]|nr:5-formyltetrahydrofolate cyclo-ligase [Oxalobacter formigenes]